MKNSFDFLKLVTLLALFLASGHSFAEENPFIAKKARLLKDGNSLYLACSRGGWDGTLLGYARLPQKSDLEALMFIHKYGRLGKERPDIPQYDIHPFRDYQNQTPAKINILTEERDKLSVYTWDTIDEREWPYSLAPVSVRHSPVFLRRHSSDPNVVFENETEAQGFCKGLFKLCKASFPDHDDVSVVLTFEPRLLAELLTNEDKSIIYNSFGVLVQYKENSDIQSATCFDLNNQQQ